MVDQQDFTKAWNMDQIILAPGTASLLIAHYRRREQELLEAGNRYLERARTVERKLEKAREVMEPFSVMAGELFARNWKDKGVVVFFDEKHKLTFADFRAIRSLMEKPE